MDGNTITYVLAAPALALLAIIPAFLFAARQAKKSRKQTELEAHNAVLDKKREDKLTKKQAGRKK